MRKVLLIIDVQNAMFEIGEGVYKGKKVAKKIKSLIDKAREKGAFIIYVQHCSDQGPFKAEQALWEIYDLIKPESKDIVIRKKFADAFLETGLEQILEDLEAEQLVICGMQSEYCVDTTTRSAFAKGYRNNILVKDAHTTFDMEHAPAALIRKHHNAVLGSGFATCVKAEKVEF